MPWSGHRGRRAPVQKRTVGTNGGAVRAPPPAKCAGQRHISASSQVRGLRGRRIDHRGTGRASTVTGGSLRTLCATLAGDRADAGRSVRVADALVNLPRSLVDWPRRSAAFRHQWLVRPPRAVSNRTRPPRWSICHRTRHRPRSYGSRGKPCDLGRCVGGLCPAAQRIQTSPATRASHSVAVAHSPTTDRAEWATPTLTLTDRTALRADGSPLLGPPSPAGCPAMRPTDPAPDRVGPALVAPRLSDAWLCWTRTRVCTPRGSGAPLPAVGTVRTGDRSVYVGLGGVATVSDAERGSQRTCTGI